MTIAKPAQLLGQQNCPSPELLLTDSLVCCSKTHLILRLSDYSQPEVSTATDSNCRDKYGKPQITPSHNCESFKTFLFQYFHDGSWWSVEMPALSQEDAIARMKKLPLAQYSGELVEKIEADMGTGTIVQLRCWFHNFRLRCGL